MTGLQPLRILVVDDQQEMRDLLCDVLRERDYAVYAAGDGEEALAALSGQPFELIISDIRMPSMDGVTLLERVKAERGFTPFVILITAFGDINDTVRLIDRGAYDYLIKPFKTEQLLITVKRAERELAMRRRVAELEERLEPGTAHRELVGRSDAMARVQTLIDKIAPAEGGVLIEGETGTGKELVARSIHRASPRCAGPFVAVNCAALPEGLLESELFGHARGAFTGATQDKLGLFLEAHGGTLFLDEIGEMSAALQAKLLRALQERQVRPVGGTRQQSFDVRVLAATNRNLLEEARQGRFREDIYYRIATFHIEIPPLRRRREDIPALLQEFTARHPCRDKVVDFEPEALRALMDYSWPGNVRELQNVVERCCYLCDKGIVRLADLPPEILRDLRPAETFAWPDAKPLAEVERDYIRHVLRRCGDNKVQAAEILGINRKTIQRKLGDESL